MKGPVLIVPASEAGMGGGHLARCAELAAAICEQGGEAVVYSGTGPGLPGEITNRSWGLVVLDRFSTTKEELGRFQALGPVAGIDEGGCREEFDFLIDLLPNLTTGSGKAELQPNLLRPDLLPRPQNRRPAAEAFAPLDLSQEDSGRPLRILTSFGAEDAAGLTVPAAKALARESRSKSEAQSEVQITAAFGHLNQIPQERRTALKAEGVAVTSGTERQTRAYRETFASYDLLITHFGLGAFEALSAGTPVLLVSPTVYHEELAVKAGFVSAGVGDFGAECVPSLLFTEGRIDPEKYNAIARASAECAARWNIRSGTDNAGTDNAGTDSGGIAGLARLLLSWEPELHRNEKGERACPICGDAKRRIAARFDDRSYWFCPGCGIVWMDRTSPPPQEYNDDYYFEDYRKQYGKTYLEDFPHLKELAKSRLSRIQKLLHSRLSRSLLDIGCAYGPFLAASRDRGFVPAGFDPSAGAVYYVRKTLGIPAERGFFPADSGKIKNLMAAADATTGRFCAITLWYVIEHFTELRGALLEANRLLEKGGVLAFSTPSFAGISRRNSLYDFLRNSPGDHRTIWDPRLCKKILGMYGFKLKKIVITGHHPERMRQEPGRLMSALLTLVSKIFRLGDTFECYAVKVETK
jgi:SAM-dependent methyltransferase